MKLDEGTIDRLRLGVMREFNEAIAAARALSRADRIVIEIDVSDATTRSKLDNGKTKYGQATPMRRDVK